jgi:dipeptidase, putative
MDNKLYAAIDLMEKDMVDTLKKWIRIPSVKAAAQPCAPFGEEIKKALDAALEDAEKMGFEVRNFDGYAGDVTMGQGEDTLGILCHVDVVPAGDGWKCDPFAAVIEGDKMYGRGTSDDKGPAVAALYAMKAVKDAGIPLKKKVRLILGCDEESGWECMTYYQTKTQMPDIGFSPDASFPVINTEKGMIRIDFSASVAKEGLKVLAFNTGERPNVVPGHAQATVAGDKSTIQKVAAFKKETGFDMSAKLDGGIVTIDSVGATGHAAYPEAAKNAIGQMLLCLKALGVEGPLKTLADTLGMEYHGESLGCAVSDTLSGALTLNCGIIRVDENTVKGVFDIRYPVSAEPEKVVAAIKAKLSGFEVKEGRFKAPHHVPEESELVQELLNAYHEETGLPKEAQAIGGGTYARCLKQGVAFGSAFPDDEELAHQAGEYLSIKGLMKNVKIFANAIIRLAGK